MPGWRHHSCEEAALARVEGADQLTSCYGYWPSFHDALVETITIDSEEASVTLCFNTNDLVEKEGEVKRDKQAVVTLRWEDVSDLTIHAQDWGGQICVWDMLLTLTDTGIRTELQPNGELGLVIVASRMKVLEVRPIDTTPAS